MALFLPPLFFFLCHLERRIGEINSRESRTFLFLPPPPSIALRREEARISFTPLLSLVLQERVRKWPHDEAVVPRLFFPPSPPPPTAEKQKVVVFFPSFFLPPTGMAPPVGGRRASRMGAFFPPPSPREKRGNPSSLSLFQSPHTPPPPPPPKKNNQSPIFFSPFRNNARRGSPLSPSPSSPSSFFFWTAQIRLDAEAFFSSFLLARSGRDLLPFFFFAPLRIRAELTPQLAFLPFACANSPPPSSPPSFAHTNTQCPSVVRNILPILSFPRPS